MRTRGVSWSGTGRAAEWQDARREMLWNGCVGNRLSWPGGSRGSLPFAHASFGGVHNQPGHSTRSLVVNFRRLVGNRIFRLLKTTLYDWMEDRALRLSAALAFYSVFSIAPLLVIAMGLAGLVLGEEAVRGHL